MMPLSMAEKLLAKTKFANIWRSWDSWWKAMSLSFQNLEAI